MFGDPSTQREFESHLVEHTGCTAKLDESTGDVVPVAVCREGEALQYAAAWDADQAHLKHMVEDQV
jgi:hypothetical protein